MKISTKSLLNDIYSFDEDIEFELIIGLNPDKANEQHHTLVPISNIELYNKLEFTYGRNFFYEGHYGEGIDNTNTHDIINATIMNTIVSCWEGESGIVNVPKILDLNCNFGEISEILEKIYINMFTTDFHELSEFTVAIKTSTMGRDFTPYSFYDMTGTSATDYNLWIAKVIYGNQ